MWNTSVSNIWSNKNTKMNNWSSKSFNDSRPPHSYNSSASVDMDLKQILHVSYAKWQPLYDQSCQSNFSPTLSVLTVWVL